MAALLFSSWRRFSGRLAAALIVLASTATGTAGLFDQEFYPWNTVLGRDGRFYGGIYRAVYAITPSGALRPVSYFPQVGSRSLNRTGSGAEGLMSVGQDGAIYGATVEGGAFANGVVFKMEPTGRRTVLAHLEGPRTYKQHAFVARNGDVYVAQDMSVVKVSADGSIKTIPCHGYAIELTETTQGEIILSTGVYGGWVAPTAFLFRLDANDQWVQVAEVGPFKETTFAHNLVPRADGSILCLTDKLLHVTIDGTVTVLHPFALSFEGVYPTRMIEAKDGSFIGSTYAGGLEGFGTVFRFVPETQEYTVLDHLPSAYGRRGRAPAWLKEVFPLWAEAASENRPPCARADYVAAERLSVSPAIDVLKNDKDFDGDALTIVSVGEAQHGAVSFDFISQTLSYVPASAEPEYDTFSYTIADGNGGTAQGRVVIQPSRAGVYRGDVSTAANPQTGDPGTTVGSLVVRVNAQGVLAGRLKLIEEEFTFAGQFSDNNVFGTPLFENARQGRTVGTRLWLKPVGSGWQVDAVVRKNGLRYRATGVESAVQP